MAGLFRRRHRGAHAAGSLGTETDAHGNRTRRTASTSVNLAVRSNEEPQYYLRESGNFFDVNDAADLSRLRDRLRTYAMYDDTLSIVVNLCSMFVTAGARIQCSDSVNQDRLNAFFKAQGMQGFLTEFVREYFIAGEATSFAYWSDAYRCFSEEQILDPDDVEVMPSIYTSEDRIIVEVPENIRQVFEDTDNPESEDARRELSDLYEAARSGRGLAVDNDRVLRMVNKAAPWDLRGVPFFTPALSALAQKESLDAALYEQLQTLIVPTIIGEVGLPAGAIGPNSQAWIPTQAELDDITDTYRTLLMAKLRVGVFPIGVKWSNAFGGSQVPNLDNDYKRCQTAILRCVAAGQGLLDGSSGGPFASNAINRDVFSSFLQSIRDKLAECYQKRIDTAVRELGIVAMTIDDGSTNPEDAGRRVPVLGRDGAPVMEQATLVFDDGVMRDANAILQTVLQLKQAKVPLSNDTIAKASGLDINVMDEIRKLRDEADAAEGMDMPSVVEAKPERGKVDTDTSLSRSEVRSPLRRDQL